VITGGLTCSGALLAYSGVVGTLNPLVRDTARKQSLEDLVSLVCFLGAHRRTRSSRLCLWVVMMVQKGGGPVGGWACVCSVGGVRWAVGGRGALGGGAVLYTATNNPAEPLIGDCRLQMHRQTS